MHEIELIKQLLVDRVHLRSAEITQQVVDLSERALLVRAVRIVGDGQALTGMQMFKRQRACWCGLGPDRHRYQGGRSHA